jgi:hypothetical protein
MSIAGHGLLSTARFVRFSLTLASALAFTLVGSAKAGTVLQFDQSNPTDTVAATDSGGTTFLSTMGNADGGNVSIPVTLSNYGGAPFFPPIPAFETFLGVHSVSSAVAGPNGIVQLFAGSIEFSSAPGGAGTDFLTATFSHAVFSGSGNSASLNATAPDLSLSAGTGIAIGSNTGMSLSFSGFSPTPLAISGGSIAPFTAQNAGTFSATGVPEPSSLCLAAIAAVTGMVVVRGRKTATDVK